MDGADKRRLQAEQYALVAVLDEKDDGGPIGGGKSSLYCIYLSPSLHHQSQDLRYDFQLIFVSYFSILI